MYFENLTDLVTMDGHGVFVWSVYAIVLAVLLLMSMAPLVKKRRFMLEQSMRLRRESIQKTSSPVAKN